MNESRILAGLPVFRAVATLGSFSTAAGQLGVTPSAVSQSIRALEDQIGARLIARTSRSMRLTEAGARLLADIDAPLTHLTRAMQGVRQRDPQIEGALRILLSPLAAEICISPHLPGFMKACPAIRLDLACGERPADPLKEGFDAVIGLDATPAGEVISMPFGPVLRRRLLASPAYLDRHGIPQQPEDLTAHRLCRYRPPGTQRPEPLQFQRGEQRLALDPPAISVLDDARLIGAVLQGGQAMAQILCPGEASTGGSLTELLTAFAPPPLRFHLSHAARQPPSPALRAFLDWFADGRRGGSVQNPVLDQLGPLDGQEVIV